MWKLFVCSMPLGSNSVDFMRSCGHWQKIVIFQNSHSFEHSAKWKVVWAVKLIFFISAQDFIRPSEQFSAVLAHAVEVQFGPEVQWCGAVLHLLLCGAPHCFHHAQLTVQNLQKEVPLHLHGMWYLDIIDIMILYIVMCDIWYCSKLTVQNLQKQVPLHLHGMWYLDIIDIMILYIVICDIWYYSKLTVQNLQKQVPLHLHGMWYLDIIDIMILYIVICDIWYYSKLTVQNLQKEVPLHLHGMWYLDIIDIKTLYIVIFDIILSSQCRTCKKKFHSTCIVSLCDILILLISRHYILWYLILF